LDPLVGVDDAFAPDGVEIGERLFRDGFQIDTSSIASLVGQVSNFLELDFWGVSEVSLVRSARPSGYKRLCN
jgi:hypothetical protein